MARRGGPRAVQDKRTFVREPGDRDLNNKSYPEPTNRKGGKFKNYLRSWSIQFLRLHTGKLAVANLFVPQPLASHL